MIKGTAQGMVLAKVALGINIQVQILDRVGLKPIIPEGGPTFMNAGLFSETWGCLGDYFRGNEETCMRKVEPDSCFVCGSLNPMGLHLSIAGGKG